MDAGLVVGVLSAIVVITSSAGFVASVLMLVTVSAALRGYDYLSNHFPLAEDATVSRSFFIL